MAKRVFAGLDNKKAKNKVKYECPSCLAAVWGKPALRIVCGDCGQRFKELSAASERTGDLAVG